MRLKPLGGLPLFLRKIHTDQATPGFVQPALLFQVGKGGI
jgi:hypothetical protein